MELGLLADLPRKNCWTIAEHAGGTPHGLQHLLARAKRNADAVRGDLCAYVVDHLADEQAVLVPKPRFYLTYTSRHGHAAIDRAPYRPKSWTSDPERCGRPVSPTEPVSPPNPNWPSG
ncbi:hypothetical protein ACFYYU_34520 [Streptomyces olivochromogenes]|uniref:hypothetical protein n=1 Tax=Streptomyces olivochromogenes TaxID=1963 RepID=UPI00369AC694